MKRYLLLMLLMCLLGSNALAQKKSASNTSFTHEVIDFTGWINDPGQNQYNSPHADITWSGNNIQNISSRWNGSAYQDNVFLSRDYTTRFSVDNPGNNGSWQLWWSGENECSYLQMRTSNPNNIKYYIHNLHVGDIVRIWCQGQCYILTDNTATHDTNDPLVWNFNDPDPNYSNNRDRDVNDRDGALLNETRKDQNQNLDGNELKIVNDHNNGTLVIRLANQYAGIIKVEIDAVQTTPRYDYDASLEVYDMYETRSNNGAYSANDGADFKLNDKDAYYLKFTNNDLSLNERIAIDKTNTWTFAHGIQASSNWSNLSICNLREGDRVLIYYTGDAPTFSSNGKDGGYTGNAAFKDTWNDGMLDANEGDYVISNGNPVDYSYCRKEGAFGNEENYPHIWLYTSYPYIMMENGHLDLALSNGNHTRIVKVKIFSDHQAMMVDDYDNETYTYTAYYNITGELQAKEHIVPGGLEVHVGNDDAADQNANVVFSKEGPVSYVKAVDGYKIPGIYRDNNDQIQNNFNLANEAPTTGTYYRFIPESSGQMTIRFKATSLNYYRWDLKADDIYFNDGGWTTEFDRSNEWPMDRACPYYLMVQDGNSYSSASFKIDNSNNLSNGAFYKNNEYCTLTLDVQAGKTYYLYGTWDQNKGDGNNIGSTDADLTQRPACGIAELLWVKFNPENKIYPLAKWVPNDTKAVNEDNTVPNPDDPSVLEGELATVIGYVGATITVKKMSGNITACRPYIKRANPDDREGKLMIDGIQFASNKNPGGTILIKIGNPELKTSPLYALTIAYSTDPKYNGENGKTGDDGRGHTWDLTTNSLYGMEWDLEHDDYVKSEAPYETPFTTSTGGYATPTPYGTYFKDYYANEASIANYSSTDDVLNWFKNNNKINTGSLLEEEIDYPDHHGNIRSDWIFNYNLVYGDKLYDPIFSNKYDMEGDNADMIWDTEGTVIRTSANQSVIFNEFTGDDIHSSSKDPNRYVGILEGGEFRIPWLEKNDRVIIYMGTGTGRYADEAKFSIRGAYDAVHNAIDPADDYVVGGSQWNSANSDNNYRGCYHFFAQGDGNGGPADMVFKMKEGSLCKIYKIQIYRGDRIITNEIVGTDEANNKFLLSNTAPDPNDGNPNATTVQGDTYDWTLQYFGKEQKLADGTGKNRQVNEIIAQSGNITKTITTDAAANTFTYEHATDEIGTFRMRGKDMEKNMNYVADYADHNVTIALQETQKYPYTWDFTDVTGFGNVENLFSPEEQLGEKDDEGNPPTGSGVSKDVWNSIPETSYQKTARDLSLWEVSSTEGFYFLRLNSEVVTTGTSNPRDNIFETAQEINGNQVWANGQVVPETQGLWFYTANNTQRTPKWLISANGMDFYGTNHTLVVPNVPAGAAVYLRMAAIPEEATSCTYQFQEKVGPNFENVSTSAFKVYNLTKVENTLSEDATSDEYIVAFKNISSSKKYLILSIGGYELKKLSVSTDSKKVNIKGYASESRDHAIDASLLPYFTDKPMKSYLVSSPDYTNRQLTLRDVSGASQYVIPESTGYVIYNPDNTNDSGEFNPFDDGEGFHLFVPDMHDDEKSEGKFADVEINNGLMVPVLEEMTKAKGNTLQPFSGDKTNYTLSYKWYDLDANGNHIGQQHVGDEMFYRVSAKGISMHANSAYLQLPTNMVKPSTNNPTGSAKFTFRFVDWDEAPIPTAIEEANVVETFDATNSVWYNLNGQKINGLPTTKGLYIVNGKKVLVK